MFFFFFVSFFCFSRWNFPPAKSLKSWPQDSGIFLLGNFVAFFPRTKKTIKGNSSNGEIPYLHFLTQVYLQRSSLCSCHAWYSCYLILWVKQLNAAKRQKNLGNIFNKKTESTSLSTVVSSKPPIWVFPKIGVPPNHPF